MSQLADRVHTDPSEIARLETLITALPSEAQVALILADGRELRGTVAVRPTIQLFRDYEGQEGSNSLLRLDDAAQPAHAHYVWLDQVQKVVPLEHL